MRPVPAPTTNRATKRLPTLAKQADRELNALKSISQLLNFTTANINPPSCSTLQIPATVFERLTFPYLIRMTIGKAVVYVRASTSALSIPPSIGGRIEMIGIPFHLPMTPSSKLPSNRLQLQHLMAKTNAKHSLGIVVQVAKEWPQKTTLPRDLIPSHFLILLIQWSHDEERAHQRGRRTPLIDFCQSDFFFLFSLFSVSFSSFRLSLSLSSHSRLMKIRELIENSRPLCVFLTLYVKFNH